MNIKEILDAVNELEVVLYSHIKEFKDYYGHSVEFVNTWSLYGNTIKLKGYDNRRYYGDHHHLEVKVAHLIEPTLLSEKIAEMDRKHIEEMAERKAVAKMAKAKAKNAKEAEDRATYEELKKRYA